MFEVRSIAFSYGRRQVLRDVSFVVSPGEAVCVAGANGAGKTTLLRIFATLAVPDSGLVLIDGRNALANPYEYRRQLGYMPERPALYGDMTVKDYLVYRARLKGEPEKRIRRRVGESAEVCRVTGLLRRHIRFLSFGEQKRVALADAVLLRPRVLLLDDFLAGIDSEMRDAAVDVLSDVAAFSSVIATGHETEDLARWATRFLVLRGGIISATVDVAGAEPSDIRRRVSAACAGGAS